MPSNQVCSDVRKLIDNYTRLAETNRVELSKIDRFHQQANKRRSTTGAHADVKDKKPNRAIKPTPYDLAQSNPALARVLRMMQAEAYK